VYTGLGGGIAGRQFGVYNPSTNVWSDLSGLDVGNWLSSSTINSLVYANDSGLIYLGSSGRLGVYNFSDNSLTQITPDRSIATATYLAYDSVNDLLYVHSPTAGLFAFDVVNNLWTSLSYSYAGGNPTHFILDSSGSKLYVGGVGTTGLFGFINWSSPCVETWVKNVNVCNSTAKQVIINYTDTHQCRTNASLPVDSGTYEYCCVDTWYLNNSDCSGGFYTKQYYDIYGCGTTINLPLDNGSSLSCVANNNLFVFESLGSESLFVPYVSAYDSLHNLLFSGGIPVSGSGVSPFAVLNVSNNSWTDLSATDSGNWWNESRVYGLVFDPVYNVVYTGAGLSGLGKFGRYNISSNVWTDLSATDTHRLDGSSFNNWHGSNVMYSMARSNISGLVYTGSQGGRLGVYNISSNRWMLVNSGSQLGSGNLQSLAMDNVNNILYVGSTNGKLYSYNISNPNLFTAFSDLSGSDTLDWIGSSSTFYSMDYDAIHNLVYFTVIVGGATKIGVYNPVTTQSYDLSYTKVGSWFSTAMYNLVYDSALDLVYIAGQGKISVFNPLNATWSIVKTMNNWYSSTSVYAPMSLVGDSIYVGVSDTNTAGIFGRRMNVSCVENWLPYDSVCNGFSYTLGYYDANSCGTTNYVPSDNGTFERCNFNFVSDTWYDLSTTDRLPEYNWMYSGSPIGVFNDSFYMSVASIGVQSYLAVYNPVTNILSPVSPRVDTGNNAFIDGDLIWTNPQYNSLYGWSNNNGFYNLSSGVFTDISGTDPNDWMSLGTVQGFARIGDYIYTSTGGSVGIMLLGEYSMSSNVWSQLNVTIPAGFNPNLRTLLSKDDMLYFIIQPQSMPPVLYYMGMYNVSSDSFSVSDIMVNYSLSNAQIYDMVLFGDGIYTLFGYNSGVPYSLGVFNISTGVWSSLISNVTFQSIVDMSVDSVNGLIYVYNAPSGYFGVYNISSNVLYNHSIFGNTSVGDELPSNGQFIYFDSANEVLYSPDSGGFHVYKTPFNPITCTENWIQQNTSCNGVNYTVGYYDSNVCGTFVNLPVDNGSIIYCGANVYISSCGGSYSSDNTDYILTGFNNTAVGTNVYCINFTGVSNVTISCSGVMNNNNILATSGYLLSFVTNSNEADITFKNCNLTNMMKIITLPNTVRTNSVKLENITYTFDTTPPASNRPQLFMCNSGNLTTFEVQNSNFYGNTTTAGNFMNGCLGFGTLNTIINNSNIDRFLGYGFDIPSAYKFNSSINGTYYLSNCVESWVANYSDCVMDSRVKFYSDENMCGSIVNLPVDNGTSEACVTGSLYGQALNINGTRHWALPRPYVDSSFNVSCSNSNLLQVYDNNSVIVASVGGDYPPYYGASGIFYLPSGNYTFRCGSWTYWMETYYPNILLENSCVPNWVSNNSVCANNVYTVGYYDSNMCSISTGLPTDNGTISSCSNHSDNVVHSTYPEYSYYVVQGGVYIKFTPDVNFVY
jgi:hypothetical protein